MLFVVSGGPSFENSASVPSTGPLRYFWVLLLLYLLFNLKDMNFEKQIKYILPVWLIGFFWSITSAFCVSFIILPYMFYHLFIQGFNIKKTLFYLFLFPFFILIFSLIIVLYYKINLNHIPDVYSFFEYALNFSQGLTKGIAYSVPKAELSGSILLPLFLWSWILIEMIKKLDVPILGLIENMSFFQPESSNKKYFIFGKEGGKRLAKEYNLDLFSQIPLSEKKENSFLYSNTSYKLIFDDLAEKVIKKIKSLSKIMNQTIPQKTEK